MENSFVGYASLKGNPLYILMHNDGRDMCNVGRNMHNFCQNMVFPAQEGLDNT